MNFLIYDKNGRPFCGLVIEPTVSKFQVEDVLKDYLKLTGQCSVMGFALPEFQRYLYHRLGVISSEFKFGRLNLVV
jgi:hypothetical protein